MSLGGANSARYASAPEISGLLDAFIIGTRQQVLAALAMQEAFRRRQRARNAAVIEGTELLLPAPDHIRYAAKAAAEQIVTRVIIRQLFERAARRAALRLGEERALRKRTVHNLDTGELLPIEVVERWYIDTLGRTAFELAKACDYGGAAPMMVRNLDTGEVLSFKLAEKLYGLQEAPVNGASAPAAAMVKPRPQLSSPRGPDLTTQFSMPASEDEDDSPPLRRSGAARPTPLGATVHRAGAAPPSLARMSSMATESVRSADDAPPLASFTIRRRERRMQPLMSGLLLKRGKKLGHWKARWYLLTVSGELSCHRSQADAAQSKPPSFSTLMASARVTVLSRGRLELEVRSRGLFGFVLTWHSGAASGQRELFADSQRTFEEWIRAFALLGACSGAAVSTGQNHLRALGDTLGHVDFGGHANVGHYAGGEHAKGEVVDKYGFRLAEEHVAPYQAWCQGRSKELARDPKRHERWMRLLHGLERDGGAVGAAGRSGGEEMNGFAGARAGLGLGDGAEGGASERAELSRLLHDGVPHALRARVWLHASGMARVRVRFPHHYAQMLEVGMRLAEEDRSEIEIDLPRTFPNHPLFGDSGSELAPIGRTALRNVLLAFSAHNQSGGYCQALNFLCAMLLLVTDLKEEPAFWLLLAIVDIVPDFYSRYMTGIRIEQNIFARLTRAALPRLAAHFDQVCLPLSIVTTNWFMCLFANTLPAETVLRVWDVLLSPSAGSAVLVRVGIALLKAAQADLLATSDFVQLAEKLQRLGCDAWDATHLLNEAFKGLGTNSAARSVLSSLNRVHATSAAVTQGVETAILEVQHRMREQRVSSADARARLSATGCTSCQQLNGQNEKQPHAPSSEKNGAEHVRFAL